MGGAFAQCAKISVYYHEWIPYVTAMDDGLTGLTATLLLLSHFIMLRFLLFLKNPLQKDKLEY